MLKLGLIDMTGCRVTGILTATEMTTPTIGSGRFGKLPARVTLGQASHDRCEALDGWLSAVMCLPQIVIHLGAQPDTRFADAGQLKPNREIRAHWGAPMHYA